MISMFYSAVYAYMIFIVGVITRSISMAADAVVLGLTLWKTIYIFREDAEVRANSKLTTTLAHGGNAVYMLIVSYSLTDTFIYRLYSIWISWMCYSYS